MMAILSDIHGNYPALAAVIADADRRGCDRIISLGDVAGYYCMVNECTEVLRRRNVLNLMGNHDRYLLDNENCPRSRSANRCLDFQRSIVTQESLNYLIASPVEFIETDCRFVHGGWNDPIDEYLLDLDARYFESLPGTYFFSGHTHVQIKTEFGAKTYCNPGAVGQPRDGNPDAAYALFDGESIELVRVRYDTTRIVEEMKKNGFEEYFYANLYEGTRIGGEITVVKENRV